MTSSSEKLRESSENRRKASARQGGKKREGWVGEGKKERGEGWEGDDVIKKIKKKKIKK